MQLLKLNEAVVGPGGRNGGETALRASLTPLLRDFKAIYGG